MTINNSDNNKFSSYAGWFVLAFVIVVVAYIRVRLLGVPLERDEGEFAYIADLVMKGGLPYKDVYSMKLPGIFYAYALILSLFGHSHTAIHFALLMLNIITTQLVYFMGKRLFDHWTGIIAASCYAIMSLSPSVYGISAHATNFVILPALGGTLVMLYATAPVRRKLIFLSGLLIGVSVLMKQHGLMFAAYGMVYLAYSFYRNRISWPLMTGIFGLFLAGILLPYGLVNMYFYMSGVFEDFWFYTYSYPIKYVTMLPITTGLNNLRNNLTEVVNSGIVIWFFAFIGLLALMLSGKLRDRRFPVISFLVFSFLSVCPGLYFREHYFILLLPAVSLFAAIGVSTALTKLTQNLKIISKILVYICLLASVLLVPLYLKKDYFFYMTPFQIGRFIYGAQPFGESLEVAQYIEKHSKESDKIMVLGSEPQIYFYSKRRAATGFIYMYPLLEPHKYAESMFKQMFYEINALKPKFIVLVNIRISWITYQYSSFSTYLEQIVRDQIQLDDYQRVGVIDIISEGETRYKWGEDALTYAPYSKDWLIVYRRND
ncbi:MAG: hypothetical protein A2X59_06450 [Nitrospirae bacterium GWC2_42_7]|nr:MAG: hypothetical protein A2X59_06450 [Nitrospirae bacterium GWC2_42_7]